MTCIFVTGTDTDVGKTLVSTAILQRLAEGGFQTLAMKPIAAGADQTEHGLRNSDALQLAAAMTVPNVAYHQLNPICLAPPVAPHLAAAQVNHRLNVSDLVEATASLRQSYVHELLMIEGAGGWQVPLNDHETFADFVSEIGAKVVLVVGLKLGCLNHTLLTMADLQQRGIKVIGWVANQVQSEPMALQTENVAWLQQHLKLPLLATIPYLATEQRATAASYLPASHELMSLLQGN
ncbi:dethiobiotin synthase [Pseudidiomarina sp. E22-M8]|uniref:dethiobiotin synthase n=1 Tax=Pseudidiomarina sp. E22-M8 TaxID=3424768 RepID=UPI00403C360A